MGQHLLSEHTTLRLGGPAPLWLTHTEPADWPEIVAVMRARHERPWTIGGGSNILAPDDGYPGPVVHMATRGIHVRLYDADHVILTVEAGHPLDDLVSHAVAERLSGIEFLAGIPGTVGAAPVQNAGAYGQEIADVLVTLTVYDWTRARTLRLGAEVCRFAYRSSVFKHCPGRWTILDLTLRMRRSATSAPVTYPHLAQALYARIGDRLPLAEAATAVRADRTARGLSLPGTGPDARQAGSCFLNPRVPAWCWDQLRRSGAPSHRDRDGVDRVSAGWLLEHSGYGPGHPVVAGISCSTQRTLTLTAQATATATRFRTALEAMTVRVLTDHGVRLTPEPASPPPPGR